MRFDCSIALFVGPLMRQNGMVTRRRIITSTEAGGTGCAAREYWETESWNVFSCFSVKKINAKTKKKKLIILIKCSSAVCVWERFSNICINIMLAWIERAALTLHTSANKSIQMPLGRSMKPTNETRPRRQFSSRERTRHHLVYLAHRSARMSTGIVNAEPPTVTEIRSTHTDSPCACV